MASRLRGASRVRRILRSLPESVRGEIMTAFEQFGRETSTTMRTRTPRRTGALVSRITYKLFPRSLRMQVGLIGGKSVRNRLFYGRILDLGRKGRTVQARKRTQSGAVTTYAMRVKAIPAKRFVTGPIRDSRAALNRQTKDIFTRALGRLAGGSEE
jgi:hypothetical protein